ncbi:MAG: STAS domain-containing protein [bacterium]|nr:STAS domain-containing protein [bacterium]
MGNNYNKNKPKIPFAGNICDKPPIFDRSYAGDRCMMAVVGELRQAHAESLFDEAVRLFKSGVKDLILDFRKLDYADTAGLQNLVRIYRYAKENDGMQFSILTQTGDIIDILITCRFDKFIHISQDEGEFKDNWQEG